MADITYYEDNEIIATETVTEYVIIGEDIGRQGEPGPPGPAGVPGGSIGNVQLNDGSGSLTGSNNLSYGDLLGLVSNPGFIASDGTDYAQMAIFNDGAGTKYLSLGGGGTVPTYLNLQSNGGFVLNNIFADVDITGLTDNRNYIFPNKSGTVALLSDITGGVPGGNNGQLQYNNNGGFGGSSVITDGTNLIAPQGSSQYFYNTVDQTTNYERVRIGWTTNVANIYVESGGTGSNQRTLSLQGSSTTTLSLSLTGALISRTGTSISSNILDVFHTFSGASTNQSGMLIRGGVTQTGTANYRAFFVSPQIISTGNSALLLDVGTNTANTGAFATHTRLWSVDNSGNMKVTGSTTLAVALNGLLKATNGLVSAATAGTDYVSGAAGNPNAIQYNVAGAFGGSDNFTFDGNAVTYMALDIRSVTPADTASTNLVNTTPATATIVQNTPSLHLQGQSWNTTTVASAQYDFKIFGQASNTTATSGTLVIASQINGAGYVQRFTMTAAGTTVFTSTLTSNASLVTTRSNLATTSTDGLIQQNVTAATAGVPVQYSPRIRLTGAAYNSAVPQSETNDFWIENRPVTAAGTTSANLVFTSRINGGAATDFLTLATNGAAIFTSNVTTNSAFVSSSYTSSNNDVTLNFQSRNFTTVNAGVNASFGTYSGANLAQTAFQITPIYNQTGTASATDLKINRTETATGSGAQLFADFQIGGTSKISFSTGGVISTVGGLIGTGARIAVGNSSIQAYQISASGTITSGGGFGTGTGSVGVSGFGVGGGNVTSQAVAGSPAQVGINNFGAVTLNATNTQAITNASTVFINGPPVAGANVTIANSYSLYVNTGPAYFGGDVYFPVTKGIILRTPDNTKNYRVTVDNTGNLVTTLV